MRTHKQLLQRQRLNNTPNSQHFTNNTLYKHTRANTHTCALTLHLLTHPLKHLTHSSILNTCTYITPPSATHILTATYRLKTLQQDQSIYNSSHPYTMNSSVNYSWYSQNNPFTHIHTHTHTHTHTRINTHTHWKYTVPLTSKPIQTHTNGSHIDHHQLITIHASIIHKHPQIIRHLNLPKHNSQPNNPRTLHQPIHMYTYLTHP